VKMATFKTKTAATFANVFQIFQMKLKSAQKGAHRGLMVVIPADVKMENLHSARRCFASDLIDLSAWHTKKLKLTAMYVLTNLWRTMVADAGWMMNATLRKRFQRGAIHVENKPQ